MIGISIKMRNLDKHTEGERCEDEDRDHSNKDHF